MKTLKNKNKNIKNKKGLKMNTQKIKTLVEKVKTITLIVTGAISFYAGIQFQIGKTNEVNRKINEVVKEVKASKQDIAKK